MQINNFGPFRRYTLNLPPEDSACVLLTGKNNEGKSSIISALKLVDAATRAVGRTRQRMLMNHEEYFRLLQQDVEDLPVKRVIHNYGDVQAELIADFSDDFQITVYLDPAEEIVYASYEGRLPADIETIFGFIPPLGPLSESEEILTRDRYLRANLNTSLAPRHLRNHLLKLLTVEDYALLKQIIGSSWGDIELLDYEVRYGENRINCYYREGRTDREISWAGQGLQVWFQIIAHLVRLRGSKMLIFDEPEINLHPEKQNELLRIVRDHFTGGVIIATHSVELMNNVSVSHILNVQKKSTGPKVKSTDDRAYLELVRSQIGSNFNLIASQFEDCDLVVFTEDLFDFSIIKELGAAYGITAKAFNIPLHGFSEHTKAPSYKDAYRLLIGKEVKWSMLLDRDHYPAEYLESIKAALAKHGIKVYFTVGTEIENLLVSEHVLAKIIPNAAMNKFKAAVTKLFDAERIETWGAFLTLHQKFLPAKLDVKSITTTYMPDFEKSWNNPKIRWRMISGKRSLAWTRDFLKCECGTDLPIKTLCDTVIALGDKDVEKLVRDVYRA